MQTAVINSRGTQFEYLDSGAVPGDTYSTIVIVHGICFSADVFARVLPKAAEINVRVIALNRRDYRGSSPFSEEELATINSTDEDKHKAFYQQRGLEIAEFLAFVVKEKKVPALSSDRKSGGLTLLGWSLGNATTMAFFAHLNSYPKELVETLRPYLKTHIQYEPPTPIMGVKEPEKGYFTFTDPDLSVAESLARFPTYISSFYTHPYYNRKDGSKEVALERVWENLHYSKPEPAAAQRVATSDSECGPQVLATMDMAPVARSDPFFFNTASAALRNSIWAKSMSLEKDDEGVSNGDLLPDVSVRGVHGTCSTWCLLLPHWWMEEDVEKWRKAGKRIRDYDVTVVEGANHFVHWEDPEKFLKIMSGSCS